jgi:hypothetical protein
MAKETIITLQSGIKEVSVSMPGTNLEYHDFMELIEMLVLNSGYSEHEIESYILDWASDIRSKKEN